MKVLITGGCGFLGANIASAYLATEDEVIVVDALFRTGSVSNMQWLKGQAASHQFHFVQSDISQAEDVMAIFRRHGPFDYVCHLAGQAAMTTSLNDPRQDFNTNVIGTFNVLEAVRSLCPEALLAYSSTNKVYGDLEWIRIEEMETRYKHPDYLDGLDEHIPLDFSTPYGCSKGSADQYVRDWSRVYGLKTVVFRHSSIYGGRQFASFDQGWVGWFCKKALIQQKCQIDGDSIVPFTIAGSGKQVRDVLHAKDLVSLYLQAYQCKDILNGEVFNIGGGVSNSLSLIELFDILSDKLNMSNLVYQKLPRRASDQDCFIASIEKAHQILNWHPKVDFDTGISNMLEWCRNLKV
jgi:CDP-paratose 2-epimerase